MKQESVKRPSTPRWLILFTRYPEPGKTKTRLIPAIGAEKAALLQKRCSEKVVASYRQVVETGLEVGLLVNYSGAKESEMRAWLGGAHYCRQKDGDLGARMASGFGAAKAMGARKMLLVGSDIPGITPGILRQAFDFLDEGEAVIGPSEDGGFYAIGFTIEAMDTLLPSLFEGVSWSTGEVCATIYHRLREDGWQPGQLPELTDVDTPEDLEKIDLYTLIGGQ